LEYDRQNLQKPYGKRKGHAGFENVDLLRKDFPANPCHEIGAGGLCPPLSDNLKVKRL
jgi:hypothetical protein